ncbi:hypothetical protein VP01_162g2 [Puccinia sorghi]|uniref:Uncharacterized protein n=1 Tax=Puccinia sorghi TaxID=27349 RepID=A0A0L6VGU4_9BASI|nr:hypothetical protein VP01_162g2 [Puccinia sorghi]
MLVACNPHTPYPKGLFVPSEAMCTCCLQFWPVKLCVLVKPGRSRSTQLPPPGGHQLGQLSYADFNESVLSGISKTFLLPRYYSLLTPFLKQFNSVISLLLHQQNYKQEPLSWGFRGRGYKCVWPMFEGGFLVVAVELLLCYTLVTAWQPAHIASPFGMCPLSGTARQKLPPSWVKWMVRFHVCAYIPIDRNCLKSHCLLPDIVFLSFPHNHFTPFLRPLFFSTSLNYIKPQLDIMYLVLLNSPSREIPAKFFLPFFIFIKFKSTTTLPNIQQKLLKQKLTHDPLKETPLGAASFIRSRWGKLLEVLGENDAFPTATSPQRQGKYKCEMKKEGKNMIIDEGFQSRELIGPRSRCRGLKEKTAMCSTCGRAYKQVKNMLIMRLTYGLGIKEREHQQNIDGRHHKLMMELNSETCERREDQNSEIIVIDFFHKGFQPLVDSRNRNSSCLRSNVVHWVQLFLAAFPVPYQSAPNFILPLEELPDLYRTPKQRQGSQLQAQKDCGSDDYG